MTWSETILEQFELVNRFTTDESEYYGPYNTLLIDLFPHIEHFQVAPQFKGPITPGSVDFTVVYIIMKRKVPVLFIEVKPFNHFEKDSTRAEADDQMRRKFRDFRSASLPLPKLFGISALGTRFSVYEYIIETRALLPPSILPDPMTVNEVAPKERWNYELLEPAGEAKFREVVADVKAMAESIGNCEPLPFSPL
ncbi:hypothetical protein M422DRAFT_784871 [Sphaerobolus stellatus SS14]|uniref:Uncharacterized protein n=1 Tax=Sphaerobolus stellatus (strain SS14) TaxID=990650 RepID=A0A0C9UQ87_SPHS4|nr:hypothetical protein M422DRAFT_784871 [Sphaerobolus stellatus SS14]